VRLHRIEPGIYRSLNSRVYIRRVVSQQTRRADEICWDIIIDQKVQAISEDTKKNAVVYASRRCSELGITEP
jgi:hypothetical protein